MDAVQTMGSNAKHNVQVYACSGADNQKWGMDEKGQIKSDINDKCLTIDTSGSDEPEAEAGVSEETEASEDGTRVCQTCGFRSTRPDLPDCEMCATFAGAARGQPATKLTTKPKYSAASKKKLSVSKKKSTSSSDKRSAPRKDL
jgi:hypothetical protein